jgi:hypothetical protein
MRSDDCFRQGLGACFGFLQPGFDGHPTVTSWRISAKPYRAAQRICRTVMKGIRYAVRVRTDPEGAPMKKSVYVIGAWASVALAGLSEPTWAADTPAARTRDATADIAGTGERVERVMSYGEEILPPAIEALYSVNHGRADFNL